MPCNNKYSDKDVENCVNSLSDYQKNLIVKQFSQVQKDECKQTFCMLGKFLIDTRPSEQTKLPGLIIEIDGFLNEILKEAEGEEWLPLDELDQALGYSTSLVTMINNIYIPKQYLPPEFGIYVKRLGRLLKLIGDI